MEIVVVVVITKTTTTNGEPAQQLKVFKMVTPGLSGVWDQNWVNTTLYIAFWSAEPTDFKNVIVENIPPALSEDTEVAEVKWPWNSKQRKFYYEKW